MKIDQLLEALCIVPNGTVCAEHDEIYLWPEEPVSETGKQKLLDLGWIPEDDHGFMHFV